MRIINLLLIILTLFLSSTGINAQTPLKEGDLFLKGIAKKKTAIYKKASTGSGKVTKLEPFDIVYIYGKGSFYKVGPTPNEVTGYIPKSDLTEWNSRLCLHFTPLKGRQPGLVFNDPESLKECLRGTQDFYDTNGRPHSKSIAMEPDENLADQRFTMLLPILDEERMRLGTGQHMAYKIGFLSGGDASYAAPAESSKRRSSKVAELELMFLIDATGSMQPYIDGTKEIVKNVTQRILTSREGGCRFGVTAYRDYEDEFVYRQFSNLTSNSYKSVAALSSIAADGGHDTPEAVFDGFLGSLTETNWHETQNTLRLIILIGDASAHPPGAVGNPKNISSRQLLQKASEMKVRTLAVKLDHGSSDSEGAGQFMELAEGLTEADKGSFIDVPFKGTMDSEFIDKTSAKIEAEILRLEKMIKVIRDSEESIYKDPVFPAGTSRTDRAIILKNVTIKSGSPRPIEFNTGWINEFTKDGSKLLNSYVYMTKDEFDLMIKYIKFSSDVIKDTDKALAGTIKEVIEVSTGETLEGTDLEVHYKKALSLPVKSDILRIPVSELHSWGEERKSRILKLAEGKYNQLEIWGNNLENWYEAPGGGGFKYTFVPVDMLP